MATRITATLPVSIRPVSVYTPVTHGQLSNWLQHFELGHLHRIKGIAEGVQNSNFFVETSSGHYVLTLFERVETALLPFYMGLMAHLASRNILCPAPQPARNGSLLGELNGRPAALFSRLEGCSIATPTAAQCAAVGNALAALHLAGRDWAAPPHSRGSHWIETTAARLLPLLNGQDVELLATELAFQRQPHQELPGGVIHADLFRDNVLFFGDEIGGLLDFYFAGTGEWLFDLAIVANDWCSEPGGGLNEYQSQALLTAYHAIRPLTAAETAAWPRLLRAAALRFWLSRLEDRHCPLAGETVTVRDPDIYRGILLQRIAVGGTTDFL